MKNLLSLGFEIKVTESIIKQTPVVAYATGGIPHQIRHGATGFLVPTGSIHLAANYIIKMFLDKDMYRTLRHNCHSFVMEEYFTVTFCLFIQIGVSND
jgi:glycosyltransferase involved in cell wall biosynthesis